MASNQIGIDQCRAEQRRCRDWLAQHGHDAGVNGEDSRGARLGCSDWLMEELLTNESERSTVIQRQRSN